MFYKYYIKISSTWVEFFPDSSEGSIEVDRKDNTIYANVTIGGNFTFFDSEFDTLYTEFASKQTLPFKIEYNSILQWEGFLDLLGEYNIGKKACKLKTISNNPYALIERALSRSYNIYDPANSVPFNRVAMPDLSKDIYLTHLQDLIKFLIGKADPSVKFDIDSFKYFYNSYYWKFLATGAIQDASDTNVIGSSGDISLGDIFTYFAQNWHMYWTLELIGSDYYFRYKHISEVVYTTGVGSQYDLTTYRGINWTKSRVGINNKNLKRYYQIKRINIAHNKDYKGVDITIPSLIDIGDAIEYSNTKFITDIEGIYDFPSEFPISERNTFVLTACFEVPTGVVKEVPNFSEYPSSPNYTVAYTKIVGTVEELRIDIINNTVDGGAQSDVILSEKGYKHTISYNIAVSGVVSRVRVVMVNCWQNKETVYTSFPVINEQVEFYNYDENVRIFVEFDGEAGSWINFSKSPQLIIENSYLQMHKDNGIYDTWPRYNQVASQSYIDKNLGVYELFDTPALVNDTLVAVGLLKNKETLEFDVPVRDVNSLDFDYLINTSGGEVELQRLSIPLNHGLAKITGTI